MCSASDAPQYAPGQVLPDGSQAKTSKLLFLGPVPGSISGRAGLESPSSRDPWAPRVPGHLGAQVGRLGRDVRWAGRGGAVPGSRPARPDSPSLARELTSRESRPLHYQGPTSWGQRQPREVSR